MLVFFFGLFHWELYAVVVPGLSNRNYVGVYLVKLIFIYLESQSTSKKYLRLKTYYQNDKLNCKDIFLCTTYYFLNLSFQDAKGINGNLQILARRKRNKLQKDRCLSKRTVSKFVSDKSLIKGLAANELSSSLQIQQHVAFPVFLKSQLHSLRPQQAQQVVSLTTNSVAESNKWSYPVGNIEPLCCYQTSGNKNSLV